MPRKQRIYEDEQYSADSFYDPAHPFNPLIRIYSEPHHDLLFEAWQIGLQFHCKRCRDTHILPWYVYNRYLQADPPPYDVLCTQVDDIFLVPSNEAFPSLFKARKIFTITTDLVALLLSIASYLTDNAEIVS